MCGNSESSDVTPSDIFFFLYGFACGNIESDNCQASSPRTCQYGLSKSISLNLLQGDIAEYKTWLLSTMASSMYLYATCLPPTDAQHTCVTEDTTKLQVLNDMKLAYYDVAANLQFRETCYTKSKDEERMPDSSVANDDLLVACVEDEFGNVVFPDNPNYLAGEEVFTDVTTGEATRTVSDFLNTFGSFIGDVGTTLFKAGFLSEEFKLAGSTLNLVANIFQYGDKREDSTQG